jgi:sigma-54 dependent transcriptional regulator, flagellar regulatory protein
MLNSIEELRRKLTLLDSFSENASNDGSAVDGRMLTLKEILSSILDQIEITRNVRSVSLRRGIDLYDEVRRFEIDLIESALEQTKGNQARAARLLGINQTTLNQKIKRYNISASDHGNYPSRLKETA